MNHPFVKMLKFELIQLQLWLGALIFSLFIIISQISGKGLSLFFCIYLFSIFKTVMLFRESISLQTMQMYILIPVSQRTKFLSRLFISLIIYPVFLFSVGYVSMLLAFACTNLPITIHSLGLTGNSFIIFCMYYILGNSISIFFAIFLKKYALPGIYLIVLVFFVSYFWIIRSLNMSSDIDLFNMIASGRMQNIFIAVVAIFAFVSYASSYHLFLRRQF